MSVSRFYSLDVLRGVAAISVVFLHWQHFYLPLNPVGANLVVDSQPLYVFLRFFYIKGGLAVPLFFCISGFIFSWKYKEKISGGIGFYKFSVLRISRLYPLHILTLIIVAVCQFYFKSDVQEFFVYNQNDQYHFILNIFLASAWGFEVAPSFNGPAWSISVEVMLYILFYVLCRLNVLNQFTALALVALGAYLTFILPPIAQGLFNFFIGCIAYEIFCKIKGKTTDYNWVKFLPRIAFALWILWFLVLYRFGWFDWVAMAFLFPLTVILLASSEHQGGRGFRRFSVVGDISYSMYLIHFPLQFAFAWSVFALGFDVSFNSYTVFLVFFSVLFLLSYVSYRFLETPLKGLMRSLLIKNAGYPRSRI